MLYAFFNNGSGEKPGKIQIIDNKFVGVVIESACTTYQETQSD
jgi:hypothetical protein